jgi:hypothetical protein
MEAELAKYIVVVKWQYTMTDQTEIEVEADGPDEARAAAIEQAATLPSEAWTENEQIVDSEYGILSCVPL